MEQSKQVNRAAISSLLLNAVLAVIKLAAGYFALSSAMMADGFNSAGDVFSSLAAFLGNRIASKPRDKDHPHGHGKAAYIFSGVIGLSLMLVAWNTLRGSAASLLDPQPVEHISSLVVVCAVTILVKAFLFFYTDIQGKHSRNPMVLALAQDHRSDIFVTSGTLLGVGGSYYGFTWLDGTVGILISAVIAYAGFKILRDAYRVLMDTLEKASSPLIDLATRIVNRTITTGHLDALNARPVGTRFSLEIRISLPGELSVMESHSICSDIKKSIMVDEDVADVIIHVNPLENHLGPSVL